MVPAIGRIGHHVYCIKDDGQSIIKFHVKDKTLDPETSFNVAKIAIDYFDSSNASNSFKDLRFNYGGYHWKIVKSSGPKWYYRLLRHFQVLVWHKPALENGKVFQIERAWIGPRVRKKPPEDEIRQKRRRLHYQMLRVARSICAKPASGEVVRRDQGTADGHGQGEEGILIAAVPRSVVEFAQDEFLQETVKVHLEQAQVPPRSDR